MLEWVGGRPLNLVRCSGRSCWFQRNLNHPPADPEAFGAAVGRMPIKQKNGRTEDYLHVETVEGILACVDVDTVEFHGWGSPVRSVETPDRLVIDLDPGEGLDFQAVREGAALVHNGLQRLNLKSFPLLTGWKGVHVVVPLSLTLSAWDVVRDFAHNFCSALSQLHQDRFTVALPKKERVGRIFLDYLRNGRTATAVLPYSARARKGAPVATPLTWRELAQADHPARYSIADEDELIRRARSKSLASLGAAEQVLPNVKFGSV